MAESYWEVKELLREYSRGEEVYSAYVSHLGVEVSVKSVEECFERFRGFFDSVEDYAEQDFEESGLLDRVPDFARDFIDYEKYARALVCNGDIFIEDGCVFFAA